MLQRFIREQDGWSTLFSVYMMLIFIVISGIAVDISNAYRVDKKLQIAADAASLAAAATVDDLGFDGAIDVALETAAYNLSNVDYSASMAESDIIFGVYSDETQEFTAVATQDATLDDVNAVAARAYRNEDRSNPVSIEFLHLVGASDWNVNALSIAILPTQEEGDDSSGTGCESTIITQGFMNTGGSNEWFGGVCLHGETGVLTGGDDWFSENARLSSPDADDIAINYLTSGSYGQYDTELLKVERSVGIPLYDSLDTSYATLSAEMSTYGTGDVYQGGELPDTFFGKPVVVLDYTYVVLKEPGTLQPWENWGGIVELDPDTVYFAPGSVVMEGNVDASGVAIFANNDITVGGGADLAFEDSYFFAGGSFYTSGDVQWGDPDTYKSYDTYNTHLFARDNMFLGGAAGVYGVMGACEGFHPGGAMESSAGVYFETKNSVSLGGDYTISASDKVFDSVYDANELTIDIVTATTSRTSARLMQ